MHGFMLVLISKLSASLPQPSLFNITRIPGTNAAILVVKAERKSLPSSCMSPLGKTRHSVHRDTTW